MMAIVTSLLCFYGSLYCNNRRLYLKYLNTKISKSSYNHFGRKHGRLFIFCTSQQWYLTTCEICDIYWYYPVIYIDANKVIHKIKRPYFQHRLRILNFGDRFMEMTQINGRFLMRDVMLVSRVFVNAISIELIAVIHGMGIVWKISLLKFGVQSK